MSQKLEGKIALITGGSRGIGAAIAKRLAADGANVAITYTKGAEAGDPLRPLGLAITYADLAEHIFDCALDDIADQLAHRVTMTGERPTKKALVEQHGVGHPQVRHGANSSDPVSRIHLVETMQDKVSIHIADTVRRAMNGEIGQ